MAKATLRRGSFTIGDSLLMLLGALITLAGLTFFKIRSLDRIEGKVHHPLPERSSECTERAEDWGGKPSDSGTMINAGIKCLHQAKYWLVQAIDVLECARNYAKEGK